MKYNKGDKVTIKSKDWYNENKGCGGNITSLGMWDFNEDMSVYCGREAMITAIECEDFSSEYEDRHLCYYTIDIDNGYYPWFDWMFE